MSKLFQNKYIGRSVIREIIQLAKEKDIPEVYAEIYSFNTQFQRMFESIGFQRVEEEKYILVILELWRYGDAKRKSI